MVGPFEGPVNETRECPAGTHATAASHATRPTPACRNQRRRTKRGLVSRAMAMHEDVICSAAWASLAVTSSTSITGRLPTRGMA